MQYELTVLLLLRVLAWKDNDNTNSELLWLAKFARDKYDPTLEEVKQNQVQETKTRPARKQISNDTKSTKCPECEAVFTTSGSMLRHYRSKHEGVKYSCNKCDYQAT